MIWFLALLRLVAIVPVILLAKRAFAVVSHLVWTVPATVTLAILSHLTMERTAKSLASPHLTVAVILSAEVDSVNVRRLTTLMTALIAYRVSYFFSLHSIFLRLSLILFVLHVYSTPR
jgi:hypothetical protein